jgi:uncharacterized protein YqgC (DUF456 family)
LVLCFLGWLLNFVSLPGNWVCVVVVGLYVWLGPAEPQQGLGIPTLITGSVLAFLGEAIEFAAAAAGAKRAGGATRSSWLALVGSLLGSVVGALVGIPIPLIGPVIGAVLFAALGAMAGAVLGEWTVGSNLPNTMQVGKAAFWGRLLGMAGKIACGLGILVAVVVGILS